MIYQIPLNLIDGRPTTLEAYKGKALLLVNVASKCGLTPQYEGLEALFEKYQDKGLVVLGFPANNFGAQEPGTHAEIQEFCSMSYAVKFPLFEKISVKGSDQSPLYKYLTETKPKAVLANGDVFEDKLKNYGINRENPIDVLWNFEKFLIDQNGNIVERFSPDTEPNNPLLIKTIEGLIL
jgi:glutathione peroxidase